VDLRVGGRYSNEDGDVGIYNSIVPNRELVFSWDNPAHAPGTTVTIELAETQGGTRISIAHSKLFAKEQREELTRSWQWAIDCLKLFLETGRRIGFADWVKQHP
jgi:uncharacterized protein YndB with AHSA1/START domain